MFEKHAHIGHSEMWPNNDCPVCQGKCTCLECIQGKKYWNENLLCPDCSKVTRRRNLNITDYDTCECPKCRHIFSW